MPAGSRRSDRVRRARRYETAHELAEALDACRVAGTWRGAPSRGKVSKKELEVIPSVEQTLDPIPLVVRRFPAPSEPDSGLFEDEATELYERKPE